MVDVERYLQTSDVKPTVVVAPTGSGKAILIANSARVVEGKVLVLQPSKELLEQNYEKYTSYGGEASVYSASMGQKEIGHVTFATLGSVKNLGKQFKKEGFTTLLVDECDSSYPPERGSMFRTFIDELKPSHIIGFTASPFRLKSYGEVFKSWSQLNMLTFGKVKVFHSFLSVVQIDEMVKGGYWADLKYEQWDFDETNLRLNTTGAEFSEDSIYYVLREQKVNDNILTRCKQLIEEGKSALVFMDSVNNAEMMAQRLGSKAGCIHGKTSKKERTALISDFKEGKIKILTNHSTLTCGFDYPALDTVILGRPTNSLALYYQMTGRAVRNPQYPKGKKQALIIDFCNNVKRFGRIEDLRVEEVENYGWGVFSGDYILTGVPMGTKVTKKEIEDRYNGETEKVAEDPDMKFGKYKGYKLSECPADYRVWLMQELDSLKHPSLTREVKKAMRAKLIMLMGGVDAEFARDLEGIKKQIVFDPRNILLFDFNNIAHVLYSSKKLNIDGLTGYITELCKKYRTSNFKILVDSKPYWRKEIFPEYKDNRNLQKAERRFIEQRAELLEFIIDREECVAEQGFEADDFIASYVRRSDFDRVVAVSADGDFRQLDFYKKFLQFNPLTRKEVKEGKVEAVKCLVNKVLRGDAKDNVSKSHYETRILDGKFTEVVQAICDELFEWVKKNNPKDVQAIPFRDVTWKHLNRNYKMKKSVFDRNFTVINLIQDEYETRNNYKYKYL